MRTPSPEPFFRTRDVEFTCNDISSLAAGFYNPKRAVAVISAMVPFCWGWGGSRALTFTRLQGRKFDIIGVYPDSCVT